MQEEFEGQDDKIQLEFPSLGLRVREQQTLQLSM